MEVRATIVRWLGIRREEQNIIGLFGLFSFLLGLAMAFFFTPASSLFLQHFSRAYIPLGYVLGGVAVLLMGQVVSYYQTRIPLAKLMSRVVFFLVLSTSALIVVYRFVPAWSDTVVMLLFAWNRVYLYILGLVFWGLANRVFNLRQGKRIFSLIGAGEVVSYIISFASIPLILRIDGVDTGMLFWGSVLGLAGVLFFAQMIIGRYPDKFAVVMPAKAKQPKGAVVDRHHTSYVHLLYAMAILPILAVLFVEFLFFAQSQVVFQGQGDALSGFLAFFFGLAAGVEFLVKTFLSGWLVERFGFRTALLALPGMLVILFLVVGVAGLLPVLVGLFFPAIAMGRLFLRAFRTSFYDPAYQLLFQPIPEAERMAFLNAIESKIKSFGNIVAGLLLLAITSSNWLDLREIAYLFFIIALVWVWVSGRMATGYHQSLRQLLQTGHKTDTSVTEPDNAIHAAQSSTLPEQPGQDRLRWYVWQETDHARLQVALRQALHQTTPDSYLWRVWSRNFDPRSRNKLPQSLSPEQGLLAEQWIDQPLAHWAALANQGTNEEQLLAANFLGQSHRYAAIAPLVKLMRDENPYVAKAALRAAALMNRAELWPFFFEALKNKTTALAALGAIEQQSGAMAGSLVDFLTRNTIERIYLRLLIPILARHRSEKVDLFLRSQMFVPQRCTRIAAMQQVAEAGIEISRRDRNELTLWLEEEIGNLVRFAHCWVDLHAPTFDALRNLLSEEITRAREHIFLILSVLYEEHVVRLVRQKLAATAAEEQSFALEILDLTIEPELKAQVLPAIEHEQASELVAKYNSQRPYWACAPIDRLLELANLGFFALGIQTRLHVVQLIGEHFATQGALTLAAFSTHPNRSLAAQAAIFGADTAMADAAKRYLEALRRLRLHRLFAELQWDDFWFFAQSARLCTGQCQMDTREVFVWPLSGSPSLPWANNQPLSQPAVLLWPKPVLWQLGEAEVLVWPVAKLLVMVHLYPNILPMWERELAFRSYEAYR